MNEVTAMRRFEELLEREMSISNSHIEIELLYKYLSVVSLQRITDHLSSIEDALSTLDIENIES